MKAFATFSLNAELKIEVSLFSFKNEKQIFMLN